jgi:hypothetical protein
MRNPIFLAYHLTDYINNITTNFNHNSPLQVCSVIHSIFPRAQVGLRGTD